MIDKCDRLLRFAERKNFDIRKTSQEQKNDSSSGQWA